jgi:hypothetical protein
MNLMRISASVQKQTVWFSHIDIAGEVETGGAKSIQSVWPSLTVILEAFASGFCVRLEVVVAAWRFCTVAESSPVAIAISSDTKVNARDHMIGL